MVKKISKFNFGSKLALTILVISVILFVSILISALTPGVAPNPGHDIQNVAPPLGCVAGDLLKWDNPNWGCASDSYLQRRVNGICDQQTAIRAIYANGSVACQSITTGGTGDITAVYAGGGLSGGGTTGAVTLNLANFGTCPTGQLMKGISNGEIVCSSEAWQSQGWVSVTSAQASNSARDPSVSCTSAGMVPCPDSQGYVCEQSRSTGSNICPPGTKSNQIFWSSHSGHWTCLPDYSGAVDCGKYPIINIHCCKP